MTFENIFLPSIQNFFLIFPIHFFQKIETDTIALGKTFCKRNFCEIKFFSGKICGTKEFRHCEMKFFWGKRDYPDVFVIKA